MMQDMTLNTVNLKINNGHQRIVIAPRGTPGYIDHDWDGAKREFYQLAKRKYRENQTAPQKTKQPV